MFSKAIVTIPCAAMVHGLSSANLGTVSYQNALIQHQDYISALNECGLSVSVLPADESFPDSVFVEDTALLTPSCAIVTHPGAPTRRGETDSIEASLSCFYDHIEYIVTPGFVEAGDIMMVGDHYYIGLSERTNRHGAEQMIAILKHHGMDGSIVEFQDVLHLKSGVSYLENNKLLICREFINKPEFRKFEHLQVAEDESYAANSVWINDIVLTPAGFPKTSAMLSLAGFKVREVDVSEFRKLDGGLSCLSLRF